MGTNYYWHEKDACVTCGHQEPPKHIGKSSAGWVFALHIYPEEDIMDLYDWTPLFSKPGTVIKDEYGSAVTPAEMLGVIMLRWRDKPPEDFRWDENGAMLGPNNLIRAKSTAYRIAQHGAGTWDCHTGDFS